MGIREGFNNMTFQKDKWYLMSESFPEDGEDIWFVDVYGKLGLGQYQYDVQAIAQADGLGTKVECVSQWKPLDSFEVAGYPKDGSTVAVDLRDFPCYALGMFTNRYTDPETGDRTNAVILDPSYKFGEEFGEVALDWRFVNKYSYAPVIKLRRELGNPPSTEEPEAIDIVEVTPEPVKEEPVGSAIFRARKQEKRHRG